MPTRDLVRVNVGEGQIVGLGIRWASAEGGQERAVRGEPIWNPATGKKQKLYDEPEWEDLRLSTAYSTTYAGVIESWYQKNKNRTDLVFVGQIQDVYYKFINCSIAAYAVFPGFDKDGQSAVSAKRLELIISPGGRA